MARRKIVKKRLPASAGVLPIAVVSFEHVAKTDLLRDGEAERRVVDFEIARQRGKARAPAEKRIARQVIPVRLAVGDDLLDLHRRRKLVGGNAAWIDDADAV